ncbi:MAG: hypothetical protein WAP35_07125 [Solirubrobacterales bacterium]
MAEKTTTGRLISAVGGIILIISLFLTWYKVDAAGALGGAGSALVPGLDLDASVNGWKSMDIGDFVLFLVGVIAIVPAALDIFDLEIELPVDPGAIALGGGILAVLWALMRLIDLPDDGGGLIEIGRGIGIFIALVGGGIVAFGGLRQQGEDTAVTGGGDYAAAPAQTYAAPAEPAPPAAPAPPQDPGMPPAPPTAP